MVPDGSTSVSVTADQVTIAGTLVVTPAGTAGFTTRIASPTVHTTALRLQASGLAGQILSLLNNNLSSTIQSVTTRSAERAIEPLINDALGALAGPQRFDVLGNKLDLQASPSAITFSRDGALVTMNLQAKIEGSESSPGYIFTPNGTPAMTVGSGVQVGLADDLVNELLAEVHALGLLDIHLQQDFGVFDEAEIELTVPPMISADSSDGSMRLVLGDMIASVSDHGKKLISAAVNAQVDLEILRGDNAQQIALQFGKVHLFVNVLDPSNPDELGADDLSGAAGAGIGLQLDSLSQFLITVPVPSVAGVSLDNLSLRADSGYVLVSGQIHCYVRRFAPTSTSAQCSSPSSSSGIVWSGRSTPSHTTRTTVRPPAAGVADVDVIDGLAVAVVHVEAGPARRRARLDAQAIDLEAEPEQRLGDQPVHPARRARVPGPAAAAGVLRVGVDVGRDDVGLDLVRRDRGRVVAVVHRVDEPEQLPRALDVAGRGERHRPPTPRRGCTGRRFRARRGRSP